MGLNYFMIGEVSSLDYGIIISKADVYGAPEREIEEVSVPGRNGTVLFDEGHYKNVTIAYECQVLNNGTNLDAFRGWILSFHSYIRLEDTYHPGEYRMAVPKGGLSVDTGQAVKTGKFTVTFNCKPQRYLKIGEIGTEYEEAVMLMNPTWYPARPLIRVYGYGVLGIGDDSITIASHGLDYIDIDCEKMDCSCDGVNANTFITLSGADYPSLPGNAVTGITFPSTIDSIVVTPRWWTL